MTINKNILCIGAGYIGGPTMAVMALKCPDYNFTVVDINSERIAAWQTDDLPVYEPGLLEIVKQVRGKNLHFSTDIDRGIQSSEIIFVCVNTPTKNFGLGAGEAADLQYWEKTARHIAQVAKEHKIVVEKSTLPVRTADAMSRILKASSNGMRFEVLSNPEFLAEGTAVRDLMQPDRVLIGADDTREGQEACQKLVDIYARWVSVERILTTNVWSSELSKLVANAFLAQRVSSINTISVLCEKTGADVSEVSRAIGADSRIGAKFLQASIGFGGSCFQKDILNLVYIARSYGLHEVADYWHKVIQINEYQKERFVLNMIRSMFNTLAGKRIAIFGFAFKADTSDTRDTPAFGITKRLLEEHASVVIHDPKALDNAHSDLQDYPQVSFEPDPYQAAKKAHAIAVLTEWRCFLDLDFDRIYADMEKPAFLFDGRNLLPANQLFKLGFNVYSIGNAPLTHF